MIQGDTYDYINGYYNSTGGEIYHITTEDYYFITNEDILKDNATLIAKAPEMAEEIKTLQAQIKELEGAMTLACDKISEIKQKLYSVLSNK
jgi:hypothetical protein